MSWRCWRARCPPDRAARTPTADSFERELESHLEDVREIYERVIYSQKPMYYSLSVHRPAGECGARRTIRRPRSPSRLPPAWSGFSTRKRRRWRPSWRSRPSTAAASASFIFWRRCTLRPQLLARLDADPALVAGVVDIFEHSNYFADQLLRHPELLEEVLPAEYRLADEPREDLPGLRRFFRRQMLRIECDSIVHSTPIFTTLERTSDLADAVISSAYHIALKEAAAAAERDLHAVRPDDGDHAGAAGHARVRPGVRRRPGVRDPGRGHAASTSSGRTWPSG